MGDIVSFDDYGDFTNDYEQPEKEVVHALGHDRGLYYYYSTSTRQVSALKPAEHTRAGLGGIASVAQYWEKNFQDFWSKQGFSWPQLADYLMSQCRERGIYDPSRIRGRGAWLEGDQPILHIGDALIVNGERHPLVYPGSRYLYEADATLVKDITKPLLTREANWLIKICRLLRWECPASGTLLAGWIAVAPICGALQWRPSIWVTGSSGSGKSWLMDNIVNTCLSEIGLYVAFNTTEPGIRRALHCDARPVIFDEAERDSASSALRMDDIFGYQRVASSENSVQILKGDQHGKFKAYKPRSVFLFQSINVGLTKGADESRISILGLRDKSIPGDIPFADLEAATAERITPEFASGLIARSVALIPVIRQNAKTFARAIAAHMHSQRLGDQLGTLLAGAYSLHSSGLISAEDAAAYVAKEEWQAQTPQEEEKDEYRLVRHIMASRVRVNNVEMPVSRLLEASQQFEAHEGMPAPDLAQRALSEAGIKPGYQENVPGVYFSTNHPRMREMLKGTQWDASWSRSLARLPDALSGSEVIQRFALGHRSRAVWVPWATIDPRD